MPMNRRRFLKTTAALSFLLSGRAGRAAERRNAPAEDDDILSACAGRIEQYRRGDGLLVLRDAAGRPVTRATVQIEQVRHAFLFGCNFFQFDRHADPQREDAYRRQFTELFNYCTLGFYWSSYERQRGRPNYDYTDRVVDYCARHRLLCKGHPLVWDHPAGSPAWLPDDRAELARLSHERVRQIVARYRGRIDIWDVVNEATHLPEAANRTRMAEWGRSLGPVPYAAQHLQVARAANPTATLLVNDYRLDEAYFRLLDRLRTEGEPLFDAVGIQSHMHGGVWPLRKVWEVCDRYGRLGRPLHFTETTIVSGPRAGRGAGWAGSTPEGETQQAEQTARFYTALFAHPAVQAITWWDFSDAGAWQGAPAGWLRRDMSPKPVCDRLRQLLRSTWWTKLALSPNVAGEVPFRAFYGAHRVTVVFPSGATLQREIQVQAGKPNRFELAAA